jgi:trans-aconitate 2-methyltransferase
MGFMATWNPDQYLRFAAERKQPFLDLVALVEHRPAIRVLDLGCGTGEWTRELHDTLAAASTLGIDSSATMLEKARAFATDTLHFEKQRVEDFRPAERFDLVFSNAALHWIPDHEALFTRLISLIAAGGQLAVQMPANEEHPSHVTAALVAGELGVAPRVSDVLPVERYAELLHRLGARKQHVRLQIYGHLLPSSSDVVEWVKGSLLTDYQHRMPAALYERFLELYRERLLSAIGNVQPYFYTYKRALLVAGF